MRLLILDLAKNAEREETKLNAAKAYLDRVEGQPIARQVTATVDDVSSLDDRELLGELARLGGIPPSLAPGGEAAKKPN